MIAHHQGFQYAEPEDIETFVKENKCKHAFVFDIESKNYDYITDIYVDGEGDLIIEIGGDAQC